MFLHLHSVYVSNEASDIFQQRLLVHLSTDTQEERERERQRKRKSGHDCRIRITAPNLGIVSETESQCCSILATSCSKNPQ